MNKLSVTIITHNEEKNIVRCLDSLQWADEILLVDSYSTDNTLAIAEAKGARIVKTDWLGFGKTKGFAVDQTKNDWVLSIDADEEVSQELAEKIKLVLDAPKFNSYVIKRKSFYLGKMINYCGWNSDYPLRLFNKQFGNFNTKEVHESVIIDGHRGKINEYILHYTYPTIESHIAKMNRYSEISANDLLEKGKSYSPIISVLLGVNKFLKMYLLKLGFLDGSVGFTLCFNSAYGVYLKYIKTWRHGN